jgi:hypothetical protein
VETKPQTMKNPISNFYDYIVEVTQVQKKLLPFTELYGDGTRWQKKLAGCLQTYQALRLIMLKSGLIDHNYKLKNGGE